MAKYTWIEIETEEDFIEAFGENPRWILSTAPIAEKSNLIKGDDSTWEKEPLESLANSGNLSAFKHGGFWHPMDTLRDKTFLNEIWDSGNAPWKTW